MKAFKICTYVYKSQRIYRAISRGKTVISVQDAIRNAGVDDQARPHLAICQADAAECDCGFDGASKLAFAACYPDRHKPLTVAWPNFPAHKWWGLRAKLPRIPPQLPAMPRLRGLPPREDDRGRKAMCRARRDGRD
jgi:hypothetical protein